MKQSNSAASAGSASPRRPQLGWEGRVGAVNFTSPREAAACSKATAALAGTLCPRRAGPPRHKFSSLDCSFGCGLGLFSTKFTLFVCWVLKQVLLIHPNLRMTYSCQFLNGTSEALFSGFCIIPGARFPCKYFN